jgi:hypothetical protein
MIVVPDEVHRVACAKVLRGLDARTVTPQRPAAIEGHNAISPEDAEITEWAIGDEVVARKVKACGRVMCWLRHDIAEIAEAHLETEHEEMERVRRSVVASIERDRQRQAAGNAPPFNPSPEMVRSLWRHQSRTGRLHDRTSRGDELRARMALLLDRADLTHDGEDV